MTHDATPHTPPHAGKRALVVDDDPDFLRQQRAALERLGFTVVSAAGRQDALGCLGEAFDLALVDLMMEEMDGGFLLARQIKRAHPNTPIILVTAVTAETGLQFDLAESAGQQRWIQAEAMLTKPLRFDQLQREVARVLA